MARDDLQRMKQDLSIRRAEVGDLDGLVALENLAFESDRVKISRRQWAYLVRRPSGATFVLIASDEVLGALVLAHRENGSTLRIYSLAVDPSARRRGCGRRLLEHADGYAQERGLDRIHLEVSVDNAAALSLYHQFGYRPVARLSHYYGLGEDGWRMERVLDSREGPEADSSAEKISAATV